MRFAGKPADVAQFLGHYVVFKHSDGWDVWPVSGFLQGVDVLPDKTMVFLQVSEDPDDAAEDCAGYGFWLSEEIVVGVEPQ